MLVVAGLAATGWTWSLPDAAGFKSPGQARILCFHLPCAILATVLVLAAGYAGFMRLRTHDHKWDGRLAAALELGTLCAFATLATGIVFSKAQWGDWWHNDPRQTSFLMVCVILCAGLALRAGLSDDNARARATSAYAIALQVPFLFLTFVFPRMPGVVEKSLHPSDTIVERGIDYAYTSGLAAVGVVIAAAVWFMFQERAGLEDLEASLAEAHR